MKARALEVARHWLGTPYLAGASVRGVGTDCAGLIEGIARELAVQMLDRVVLEGEILAAASRVLTQVTPAPEEPSAGSIILLAQKAGGTPQHAALVTDAGTIIHAHWSAGVVENRYGNWFRTRTTHVFEWPEPPSAADKTQ